jgi:polar amino acid transport system substrate-binding protein
MLRHAFLAFVAAALIGTPVVTMAAATDVPPPGASKHIDEIKQRGTLRAGILGGYPWLRENTSGSGQPWDGPAWLLLNEYAKRLDVKIELVPVSHETKVPVVTTGQVDLTIAPLSATEERKKVVDFVVYSNSTVCMFGKADNPKLKNVKTVDDLDRPDITIAYFTGGAEETWVPKRFKKAQARGVSGSGTAAPVEEIMAGRADVAPIDKVSWVTLSKAQPGLVSWPQGEDCLKSTEFANPVGLAVPKGDEKYLAWLTAVAEELKPKLEAEELRLIKQGETPQ